MFIRILLILLGVGILYFFASQLPWKRWLEIINFRLAGLLDDLNAL